MNYLLDTNAVISHLRSGGKSGVSRQLRAVTPADVAVCSVVRAELVYGANRSANPAKNLAQVQTFLAPFTSFPFDDPAADIYGQIRAGLDATGLSIGPNDLMIAAIAVTHGLTLVTHNTAEFGRVPGMRIEDWEATP